jgi:phosphoribosylanthranilate isomerase
VRPEVKFCGLTRSDDVDCAVELGAGYLGFVFAESPRRTTAARVAEMTQDLPDSIRKVGVFADIPVADLLAVVRQARLDVVQLHDPRLIGLASQLKGEGLEVWSVAHVVDGLLPTDMTQFVRDVDVLLLDTRVGKRVGGTGTPFDWNAVRTAVHDLRRDVRIGVAGGLRPENVTAAITALDPDIVDVSSGVEAQPGIKDPRRMRAFLHAVRSVVAA